MIRLAYILAASHSGSTLLAMLLGAHPEACTVGELKVTSLDDPDRYRCSCGQPIGRCPFWKEVTERMANRGLEFNVTNAGTSIHTTDIACVRRLLQPLHRGAILEAARDVALFLSPGWHVHLRQVRERNAALVETLGDMTGAKVIVDSSKTGLRLKYLLRDPALDVRVIRLVRDGRGVALAYCDPLRFADASTPELRAGGFGGDRDSENLSVAEAAHEWRRSNEEAEHIVAGLDPSRVIRVCYEPLCADPNATLQHVCGFLGLAPEKVVRDFRAVDQHVIGNGMRLDTTSEIRLDERWRERFTNDALKVFDSVAGSLNRRYGYA